MNEFLEMSLIGRIQALLINLSRKGVAAPAHMLWLLLGLVEAGRSVGHLTEAEYALMRDMIGELLAYSGGPA
jgi:hypothetical protein